VKAKDFIAKALLYAIIKVKGLELRLGGLGHNVYICHLEPWEPPDRGPWEDVCSPRLCPDYHRCIEMVAQWAQAQELVNDLGPLGDIPPPHREREGADS